MSKPMDVEVVSGTKQDWEPITLNLTINSESQFKALHQRSQFISSDLHDFADRGGVYFKGTYDNLVEFYKCLESIRKERNIT